jgi:hypothetical protein
MFVDRAPVRISDGDGRGDIAIGDKVAAELL